MRSPHAKPLPACLIDYSPTPLVFASGCFGSEEEGSEMDNWEWVDPVEEIEDENHSHSDLMAHRLKTPNARMIDYHNLNCDGEVLSLIHI